MLLLSFIVLLDVFNKLPFCSTKVIFLSLFHLIRVLPCLFCLVSCLARLLEINLIQTEFEEKGEAVKCKIH